MKTDTLFYELFQAAPQTFFELMQITPACPYRFESVTVKTSEKRIDGLLEPTQAGEPLYFIEIQAFPDKMIYWRTMREVASYIEQRPQLRENEWQAIVLWLNKDDDDPGLGTLKLLGRKPKPRLVSADLLALLEKLNPQSLVVSVFQPLLVDNESDVTQNVEQWVDNIRQEPSLDVATEEKLIAVMLQFVEQRFKTLTYKELSEMIRLTPLAETASGQEVIKDAHVSMLNRLLSRKLSVPEKLSDMLSIELQKLDIDGLMQLGDAIFDINSLEQFKAWVAKRLTNDRNIEAKTL